MRIQIRTTEGKTGCSNFDELLAFSNGKTICANLKDVNFRLELENGASVFIYGDIFYHLTNDGETKFIDSDSKAYLEKIFSENRLKDVIPRIEGQYVGIYIDRSRTAVDIFCDRYARMDAFYCYNDNGFFLASELDDIFKEVEPEYHQKMLAHLFSASGWYTPKGLTIYKNVRQLKVGEIINISGSGISSEIISFKPLEIELYGDKALEDYYTILRNSILARAKRKGKTWVSSSSGWDSSIILALLVDEFGPQNVGMLTGSMKYSEQADVINSFEINKIKKIGEYYGIKPEIVDFDFKSSAAAHFWENVLPHFKSRHMYSYVTFNFAKLSSGLSDVAGKGKVIFNGETSDSFHNFGFSQFATFFHTKKSFTEYADKMNCYLYGPSFFKKVLDGVYEKDKVFQIFKKMLGGVEFVSELKHREDIIESYLFPFFYGSARIPFANTHNCEALTENGKMSIFRFPYREYMPDVLSSMSEKNIYSWLIYLYLSFHSQGSTVGVHKHAMDLGNHRARSPFNDYRMIEFLSKAPENWGRGLDLNNTKYPLKWVAKNKIKFPYELLKEGPHSYLYDVIEGFSLFAEITYRSGVTEFFKDAVKDKPYQDILNDEYFNIKYLDDLVVNFINGREVSGRDFNNLVSLITLCITGWY